MRKYFLIQAYRLHASKAVLKGGLHLESAFTYPVIPAKPQIRPVRININFSE